MFRKKQSTDQHIIKYLEMLEESFGLRKAISGPSLLEMQLAFTNKEFLACIRCAQDYLGLKLTLLVAFVDKNEDMFKFKKPNYPQIDFKQFGLPDIEDLADSMNIFNRSKPAYILIPENCPLFGTKAFEKLQIKMVARKYIRVESLWTFLTIMVHELSHLILAGTHHLLKDSEIAVDLCAMTQGFYEVTMLGSNTYFSKYGYLSDDQRTIAYHWIRSRVGTPWEKAKSKLWLMFNV